MGRVASRRWLPKVEKREDKMFGLIVMTIGSVGIVAATAFEIRTHAPIYALLMKIFPLIFAVGCAIYFAGG